METHRRRRRLVVLIALSTLVLSCLPCQTTADIVPTPARTVPISTEEAQNLISELDTGLTVDADGNFTLRITEEELTSFVALNMEESVTDPQIILSNGRIFLYGTVASPADAPIAAACSIEVNQGQLQVTVDAVAVNGFPIPDTFVDSFAQQLVDFIASAGKRQSVEITGVQITEGELVVQGRIVP